MSESEWDEATVTYGTALGPIDIAVPIAEAERLADEIEFDVPGFDIGYCVYGVEQPLTAPTVVGVIVRVPDETNYAAAVSKAADVYSALQDSGALPVLNARLAKVMVQAYDSFDQDDE